MITMLPIVFNSALLSRWHLVRRKPRAGKPAELPTAVPSEAESPKDIKTLLEAARTSNGLDDLQKFLLAARDKNLQIALTLELDIVSVVSGKIENARLDSNKLIIRFKKFNSSDRDYGRIVFNKITNGNWRTMKPLHTPYFCEDSRFEISDTLYKVRDIYLISGPPDDTMKIS